MKTKDPSTWGVVFQSSLRRTEFLSQVSAQMPICTLIDITVENYSSSSNWVWLIFPTPAVHHLNYPFSSPANPLMLLQHLSVWHPIPALLTFSFPAMYAWLLLAGGHICDSNILNISALKVYSLWCTDKFQTCTRLIGSFLCEIKRYFLLAVLG